MRVASRKRSTSSAEAGETQHDEIGFWSEIKLDILKKYWPEYTKILAAQSIGFRKIYIDAFAGSGQHLSRKTGEFVKGSPARALDVEPRFDEYHFVDLDDAKVQSLRALAAERADTFVHSGDCNEILLERVFPHARYEDFARAFCLLDPYSLQLDWQVIQRAGEMKSVEIILNFPIMDMNRNVLRPGSSPQKQQQMTRFWGDESWRDDAFRLQATLFGEADLLKVTNTDLVAAFRRRLQNVAGFQFVPEPLAMRNSTRSAVYYLFFAGNNKTGAGIVEWIFNHYRKKG